MKQELREAIFERDKYCVKCGNVLRDPVAIHHRKLRKHGGLDAMSNLVALCSPCHNIAPNSVHQNPRSSYDNGYLVPSWAEPSKWPLMLPDGTEVLLNDEGQYLISEGEENGE